MATSPVNTPPAPSHQGYLETEHLKDDLRGRSVRGGAMTMACQFLRTLAATAALAVLARLLTPSDFGLLAMVAVFTNFVMMFKDLGLAMATIQRQDLTHDQVSALFWVNMAVGVAAALMVAACAPLVAWFYGEPRLTSITVALATGLVFGGLTVQHNALLRRQMRLGTLAAQHLVAAVIGEVAAILAALLGAGYWALVVMQLTAAAANMVAAWLTCRWRPGGLRRGVGLRSLLSFGGSMGAANLLAFLNRNLDAALIGWRWGDAALGLYANAYRLLLLPLLQFNQPLTAVAIPALSRLQDDPRRFRGYYRKAIEPVMALGIPAVIFLYVAADEVILAVLGWKWVEVVPIFRALAPAALVGTFNVATGWVFPSLGQGGRQLRVAVASSALIVSGFLVGLPWGPLGVAIAFSITLCVFRLPGIIYCFRGSPLQLSDLFGQLWRPLVAALGAGWVLCLFMAARESRLPLLGEVSLWACVFGAGYVLAWRLLPDGWNRLTEMFGLVRDLRRPSKRPPGIPPEG